MSAADEEISPYELLALTTDATDADIRKAYRQRSLKVHPDRNPNNPDAARKFHELNQAYELLLDPLRRMALDAKLRVKQARAERFKTYDNKRKNLVNELEERERAFKKSRMEKQQNEIRTWEETEAIKDEGRRLREEKERELKEKMTSKQEAVPEVEEEEDLPPPLDPLDTTVRLKYSLKSHPSLTTPASISALLSRFGAIDADSVVLTLKGSKSKSKGKKQAGPSMDAQTKYGVALVPFKQIGDAFAAVCTSGRVNMGLDGVEIGWVNGKEPEILGWLKKMGKLETPGTLEPSSSSPRPNTRVDGIKAHLPQHQTRPSNSDSFSSFPSTFPGVLPPPPLNPAPAGSGLDYESITLMRMRQAERERLEREILEQEADE